MIMIKKVTNKDIIDGSFVFPEGVTEIGIDAFEDCTSLEHIIIPAGVKKKVGAYIKYGMPVGWADRQ